MFSVKSFYEIINTRGNLRGPSFWVSNKPARVSFFHFFNYDFYFFFCLDKVISKIHLNTCIPLLGHALLSNLAPKHNKTLTNALLATINIVWNFKLEPNDLDENIWIATKLRKTIKNRKEAATLINKKNSIIINRIILLHK